MNACEMEAKKKINFDDENTFHEIKRLDFKIRRYTDEVNFRVLTNFHFYFSNNGGPMT